MFGWFSKRLRTQSRTSAQPADEPPAPVMREIPSLPAPPVVPSPARPRVPPGSAPPSHDVLVAQLRNVDPDVRVAAARELGRRGNPLGAPPLIAALRDEHPGVRIAAAHATGKLHDERAVDALIGVMSDDADETVRAAARGALAAIGTARADDALAEDEAVRERAAREAHARANPAVDHARGIQGLIDALRGGDDRLHPEAAAALESAGPLAVEPLLVLLREENVFVRIRAADLLARVGDTRAVAPLRAALDAVSREDRSYETFQFRDAVRRATAALTAPLAASRTIELASENDARVSAKPRADQSAPVAPQADIAPSPAMQADHSALLAPQVDDATPRAPSDNAAPRAPSDNTAPRAPSDNAAPRAPSDNAAPRAPSDNAAPRAPSDDAASRAPSDNATLFARQSDDTASSDPALDGLTDQQLGERLVEIARAALGGGRPPLDGYDARRAAARSIGAELHRRGGVERMRAALDTHVGEFPGRHPIDQAWDGVGNWLG